MTLTHQLTEREKTVLQAVIQYYVTHARPAASRSIAKLFNLGISPATIRNTMSDLEDKGLLQHPHTSAGRIPTDKAYRVYVDTMLQIARPTEQETAALNAQIEVDSKFADKIIYQAAQVLSVLTHELGVALSPNFEEAVLEKLDLVSLSSNRILLVLAIKSGIVKSIFVEVSCEKDPQALALTTQFLNERLSDLTLREIRSSLPDRIRNSDIAEEEIINIFVESGEKLFDFSEQESRLVLSGASTLASQPEFSDDRSLKSLIQLTENRQSILSTLLDKRRSEELFISIGKEHQDKTLSDLSIVTSVFAHGGLRGNIGVIGPTRMPYGKVVSLVEYTSRLLSDIFKKE